MWAPPPPLLGGRGGLGVPSSSSLLWSAIIVDQSSTVQVSSIIAMDSRVLLVVVIVMTTIVVVAVVRRAACIPVAPYALPSFCIVDKCGWCRDPSRTIFVVSVVVLFVVGHLLRLPPPMLILLYAALAPLTLPILDQRRFDNDDDGEGSPLPLSGNPPPKSSKKTPLSPSLSLSSSVDDLMTTMGCFGRPRGQQRRLTKEKAKAKAQAKARKLPNARRRRTDAIRAMARWALRCRRLVGLNFIHYHCLTKHFTYSHVDGLGG